MIRPIADRVLVLPDPTEEKVGNIMLPQNAREKPNQGTIVAIGDGKEEKGMRTKVGERILYGKHAGVEIVFDGVSYLIMREADIFAVL